ncbi:MAG: collagen triple helix repeat-containing protein [Bacteroidetes bacterium OLB12]|nr:MAG: collagen triple helix repeat-containing protein [Bacteroidetes bacterium OLB12]
MRKLTPLILLAFIGITAFGQVGIGTNNPNPKAVLELSSPGNNQGFLVPRLTSAQRNTIAPTTADKGLLVFDTDTNKFHFWSGTAWVIIDDATGTDNQTLTFTPGTGALAISNGNTVNITGTLPGGTAGGDLTGLYPNPAVANNAITSAKILDGTIGNADISTTAGIAVTKLAAGSAGQVLLTNAGVPTWTTPSFSPSGAAGGDLTGTYPNPTVANNAITSAKILDGAIANADLADGSVNTNKILDGTIGNADISTTAGIAVTKLAAGSAGQVLLTNAGVPTWTTPAFSPSGAAGGDLTGTYPNPTVANNAIKSAKIADGTITSADILDATITTADLANGAVTDAKVANVAPGKLLQGGAVTNQVLKWNGSAWAPGTDNTGSGVTGSGSGGQVTFWGGTSSVVGNPNFVWDDKNSFLGVNTTSPRGNLHVTGSQFVSTTILPASTNTYVIKSSDYIVIAPPTSTSKPMDIGLPSSDDNLGRILVIRTFGSSASAGARVSLVDSKDRLDLIVGGSYFLIYDNDSTSYTYCITLVATEVGWITIGRERNGSTN